MAKFLLDPPLKPRKGQTLKALEIARVSTVNQAIKSLDDQKALLKGWVADRYDGPTEWDIIQGQRSGECTTREAVTEAERLVETGQYDLVIMEDLSRHMRRMISVGFPEQCEDTGRGRLATGRALRRTEVSSPRAVGATVQRGRLP